MRQPPSALRLQWWWRNRKSSWPPRPARPDTWWFASANVRLGIAVIAGRTVTIGPTIAVVADNQRIEASPAVPNGWAFLSVAR